MMAESAIDSNMPSPVSGRRKHNSSALMRLLYVFSVLLAAAGSLTTSSRASGFVGNMPGVGNFANWLMPICFDAQRVGMVMQVYQSLSLAQTTASPQTPASNSMTLYSMLSDSVPKFCTLVVSIAQAKDIESSLRALQTANDLYELQLDKQLEFADNSLLLYNISNSIANSKASTKDKLLNASYHRSYVNFYLRWVDPIIHKQTGNTFNARHIQRRINQSYERASRITALRDELYTCRAEFKPSVGPNEIALPGGEVMTIARARLSSDRFAKAQGVLERSDARVAQYRSVILRMLKNVVGYAEEMDSASLVVDGLIANAYWVGIGVSVPQNFGTPQEKKVVDHESTKRKKEIVTSTGGAFYPNQPIPNLGAACGSRSNEFKRWLQENQSLVQDPLIKSAPLANGLAVCPQQDANINQQQIQTFVMIENPAPAVQKAQQIKEICNADDIRATLKNLGKAGSGLGPDYGFYRQQSPDCNYKPELRTPPQSPTLVQTFGEWRSLYNANFDRYLFNTYNINSLENPVTRAARRQAETFDSLGSSEIVESGFDEAAARMSSDQLRLLRDWRSISRCDDPDYLAKNYGLSPEDIDAAADKGLQGKPDDITVMVAQKVRECKLRESQSRENAGLFDYMLNGLLEELKNRARAQRDVHDNEIRFGIYKNPVALETEATKERCRLTARPIDIAMTQARTLSAVAESIENMNKELQNMQLDAMRKEQEEKEEQQKLMERYNLSASSSGRRAQERFGLGVRPDGGVTSKEIERLLPRTILPASEP